MGALVGWEFKKMLGRKAPWITLALCLALYLFTPFSNSVYDRSSAYIQGVRDVYRQYEGQAVTEAFQARVRQDFDGYIAARPDRFKWEVLDEGGPHEYAAYFPNETATDYDSGVWDAYGDLTSAASLEDERERVRVARERLAADTDMKGEPLTPFQRRSYERTVEAGVVEPVVHYAKGWIWFFEGDPITGVLAVVVAGMALLGLFGGEASAGMEAIVLTAKARRRAAGAKLLAAGLVAAGGVALFFGLKLALIAFTWGLDGAALPAIVLTGFRGMGISVLAALGLSAAALMLAAAACAAAVAWASARFRRMLLTLLAAGGILYAMIALLNGCRTLSGKPYYLYDNPVYRAVSDFLQALPANTMLNGDYAYRLSDRVADGGTLALLILVPAALAALFFRLAYRAFLRRRRA